MEASFMETLLGEAEAARQQELNLPPQEPWRSRGAERHAADGRMRQSSKKSHPKKKKEKLLAGLSQPPFPSPVHTGGTVPLQVLCGPFSGHTNGEKPHRQHRSPLSQADK